MELPDVDPRVSEVFYNLLAMGAPKAVWFACSKLHIGFVVVFSFSFVGYYAGRKSVKHHAEEKLQYSRNRNMFVAAMPMTGRLHMEQSNKNRQTRKDSAWMSAACFYKQKQKHTLTTNNKQLNSMKLLRANDRRELQLATHVVKSWP